MFGQETLTGFKWMGNRAKDLLDQGKAVLFAFEEAIGIYTHTAHTQMSIFYLRPVLINLLWHLIMKANAQKDLHSIRR